MFAFHYLRILMLRAFSGVDVPSISQVSQEVSLKVRLSSEDR